MTATDNLGLVKESEDDFYDIETLNANLDKIDSGFCRVPWFGVCGSDKEAVEKEVDLEGFRLFDGARAVVYFSYGNTVENITLDVNGTGAAPVHYNGNPVPAGYIKQAGAYEFVYYWNYWRVVGDLAQAQVDRLGERIGALSPSDIGAAKSNIYGENSIYLGRGFNEGGYCSSTCGNTPKADGNFSCSFGGIGNEASGDSSAVLGGERNIASGEKSTVIGGETNVASGECSHAEGLNTRAGNYASHVSGKYNKTMITGGNGANQIGDAFVIGNGTSGSNRSNALRVTYNGDILGTKAFQSSGADYAEYIKPWADGNPDSEDRVGYFVTVKHGLLHKANGGDYIAGIISGAPSVVGNADEDYYWRYERDGFNRIVMEGVPETAQMKDENGSPMFDGETHEPIMAETGKIIPNARMKLSEGYDPSLQDSYIPRKDRREWDYVGMCGVLPVRDDGTCLPDHYCKCGRDGVATFAAERGFDTYMVVERVSENIVSVVMK